MLSFRKSLVWQALHLRICILGKYARHIYPRGYCCPIKYLLPKALEINYVSSCYPSHLIERTTDPSLYRTPNTAHRTPHIEHRTPHTEHRTPKTEHRPKKPRSTFPCLVTLSDNLYFLLPYASSSHFVCHILCVSRVSAPKCELLASQRTK
jgi:hypothetical protein